MAENERKEEQKEQKEQKEQMNQSYGFAPDIKLKECKYCRVLIPKKAKICPNCKMRLKKRWHRNFFLLLLLLAVIALGAAGGYYYFYVYQAPVAASVAVISGDDSENSSNENSSNESGGTDEDGTEQTAEGTTEADAAEAVFTIGNVIEDDTVQEESTAKETVPESDEAEEGTPIELTACTLTEEDICGADGPILDYADEERIIFHDYCGMFVFDRETEEITTAFDLAAIGCQDTQGDESCKVSVTADGRKVYLHVSGAKEMYVYEVEETLLTKKSYSMRDSGKLCKLQTTNECVEADATVFRTFSCMELEKDTYLYLESGSGLIADLCYVIEKDGQQIERENLFTNYFAQA